MRKRLAHLKNPVGKIQELNENLKRLEERRNSSKAKQGEAFQEEIRRINALPSVFQHTARERQLLQVESENLDSYDIQQLIGSFKSQDNFIFKISNFNFKNPNYNLKFLNDLEDTDQYEIKWNDSDFDPKNEVVRFEFLLRILSSCLTLATMKRNEVPTKFIFRIVKEEMPGCPTAIMIFLQMVENMRKYLVNIRLNYILTNNNLVKIEQFTNYFHLTNNANFDKIKANIFVLQEAIHNSKGKGFNFDDYQLYYKKNVQLLVRKIHQLDQK